VAALGSLKKKHEQRASVAAFYHTDPFQLDTGELVGLLANIGKLRAQERIRRGEFDRADYEGVYDLYLSAYEDEEIAQQAMEAAAKYYADREANQ